MLHFPAADSFNATHRDLEFEHRMSSSYSTYITASRRLPGSYCLTSHSSSRPCMQPCYSLSYNASNDACMNEFLGELENQQHLHHSCYYYNIMHELLKIIILY